MSELHATITDIDNIIDLMLEMEEEAEENRSPVPLDVDHLETILPKLLHLPTVIMLYKPGGFIFGLIVQHPIFPAIMLVSEECFYVSKSKRGGLLGSRLLREFEEEGKRRGGTYVNVTESSGINPETVQKFYKHHGYKVTGTTFGKEI